MSIGKFHLVDVPQQIYDEPIFCDLQGTKFERKCKAINTLISIYKIIIYFQFWMKIQSKQTIKSHNFSHKNLVEHTHKSKFLMSGYCAFSKITAKDPLNAHRILCIQDLELLSSWSVGVIYHTCFSFRILAKTFKLRKRRRLNFLLYDVRT